MKITELSSMRESNRITELLSLGGCPVISVVGAGGKTTIVKQLAAELGRAVITTTTHMFKEAALAASADEAMSTDGIVWCGTDEGLKISAPPFLDELQNIPLVIEADGSKHKPFKIPAAHEPAVYKRSTAVIGVLGLNALGMSIRSAAFRPAGTASFLGTDEEHKLSIHDFCKVIVSENGLRKNSRGEFFAVLTHADTPELMDTARQIAERCGSIRVYAMSAAEPIQNGGAEHGT